MRELTVDLVTERRLWIRFGRMRELVRGRPASRTRGFPWVDGRWSRMQGEIT